MFFSSWLRPTEDDSDQASSILLSSAASWWALKQPDCASVTSHSTDVVEDMIVVPFMELQLADRQRCDEESFTECSSDHELVDERYWQSTLAKAALAQVLDEIVSVESIEQEQQDDDDLLLWPLSPPPPPRILLSIPSEIAFEPLWTRSTPAKTWSSSTASTQETSDDDDEEPYQSPTILSIWDPTDMPYYGRSRYLSDDEDLHNACQRLYRGLSHLLETVDDVSRAKMHAILYRHPETCMVRYPPNDAADYPFLYPMHFCCAAGWLKGIQACYQAFPEAIGTEDAFGFPLHYATHHRASVECVAFLVEKFPSAVRQTNAGYQTPLHLACISSSVHGSFDSDTMGHAARPVDLAVVALLLEHYPTAAQLADGNGWTPLHHVCRSADSSVELVRALIQASPGAISATTRQLERPVHVAAEYNAELVELLVENDINAASATDQCFQMPLHYMAKSPTNLSAMDALIRAYPLALEARNDDDQRPYDIALEHGALPKVLDRLDPQKL